MSRQETYELGGLADAGRSRAATALFVVGLATVCANSALYFFGVDSLSHPAISILGLALLAPLYLKER
jgi:hypothetical protein